MADFMKMAPVTSAELHKKNKHDVSCHTLTSLDFYKLNVVYARELDPDETIDIDVSNYVKLNPMVKPILGNCRVVNRAFFVPYFQVMRGYNEFATMVPYNNNLSSFLIKKCCYTTYDALYKLFIYHTSLIQETTLDESYDFSVFLSGSLSYYNFTPWGRAVYSILIGLGYKIIFPQSAADEVSIASYKPLSALPILCYGKLFYDWYANRVYQNAEEINNVLNLDAQADGVFYNDNRLAAILMNSTFAMYGSDYFTAQFDRPTAPSESAAIPSLSVNDVTVPDVISSAANIARDSKITNPKTVGYTPIIHSSYPSSNPDLHPSGQTIYALSQYIIDMLKPITDITHARQLAGNKVIDNYKLFFGIDSSYDNIMQSEVISHFDTYVNVGEVTANTENSSANQVLGDFAGKAEGYDGKSKIHYYCKNRGMLIVVAYVEAQTGYVQGTRRYLHDVEPTDIYSGRFDGYGPQATYIDELYGQQVSEDVSPYSSLHANQTPEDIFGFMPRFAHQKIGYDTLSGDFFRHKFFNSMSCWHLFRNFEQDIYQYEGIDKHNYQFCLGSLNDFNRIFAVTDGGLDNFNSYYYFRASLYSSKLPLWQDYMFEHDDEHKRLLQQINGSKVD